MTEFVVRRFKFDEGSENKIQHLLTKCGTNDLSLVISDALRLYSWAIEEITLGNQIASIDKNNITTNITTIIEWPIK